MWTMQAGGFLPEDDVPAEAASSDGMA
jgi:hypothetical protein